MPVEPEKIQRMLEAARIASHWGNVQSLRAVVVFKDLPGQPAADEEVLESLGTFIQQWQMDNAPVVIFWYIDPQAVDEQDDKLRELVEAGALGFGDMETRKEVLEEQFIPMFDDMLDNLKEPGANDFDAGQGVAQATLMAWEQGLGTVCVGGGNPEAWELLGIPERCRPATLQLVGYPFEHPMAGGQRPRMDFEEIFHMNNYEKPFERDEDVVEELKEDDMLQEKAPVEWRDAELDYIERALELEDIEPGLL